MFDLVFYDQLHTRNDYIRLTFDSGRYCGESAEKDEDLIPPLDLLLLTKF